LTIQQVVELARAGELNNISVKDDYEAILTFINLGLIELYKRFPLHTKEHIIELQDGVEIYDMPEDFMWMVSAYDEVDELSNNIVSEIPINEEDNPASINIINWKQVQIPVTAAGAYISIIYVASPEWVTEDDMAEDIALPAQMIEALLHYIGYRGHGSVNGNINAENSTHYQRFEISCARIQKMGMYSNDDVSTRNRIYDRGFI
jgi:hypothetical protein